MIKVRKEEYPQPEDGSYIAQLVKVEEVAPNPAHPDWGASLKFTFSIAEEPYMKARVMGFCNTSWRPGNKLDKWLTALGLDTAAVGTELDPEQLIGRYARIVIERNPKTDFVNVKMVTTLRANEMPNARVAALPVASAPVAPPPAPTYQHPPAAPQYAPPMAVPQTPLAPRPPVAPVYAPVTPPPAPTFRPAGPREIPF